MSYYVSSDHHFGQQNLHKFNERYNCTLRHEFADADEMIEAVIERHNAVVPQSATVYFLGDTAYNVTYLSVFERLNGAKKILVMGNHDSKFKPATLLKYFDEIHSSIKLEKKYILTHIPIHPQELFGLINVHGHLHRDRVHDDRYISACLEANDYSPLVLN